MDGSDVAMERLPCYCYRSSKTVDGNGRVVVEEVGRGIRRHLTLLSLPSQDHSTQQGLVLVAATAAVFTLLYAGHSPSIHLLSSPPIDGWSSISLLVRVSFQNFGRRMGWLFPSFSYFLFVSIIAEMKLFPLLRLNSQFWYFQVKMRWFSRFLFFPLLIARWSLVGDGASYASTKVWFIHPHSIYFILLIQVGCGQ